jgi:hypothetical protein
MARRSSRMKSTKPLAAALAELDAYLLQQQKQRFTGRLQITIEFNRGGVSRATMFDEIPGWRWPGPTKETA